MSAPRRGMDSSSAGLRASTALRRRLLMPCSLAAGLLVAPAAQASCPLPASALQSGAIQAAWTVDDGGPIRVGHHVVLMLRLCPRDAALLRIDAVMPEHGHGMNYRPSVTAAPAGRWRAEGLLFHMPGTWELRLDVQADGRTERLRQTIVVP